MELRRNSVSDVERLLGASLAIDGGDEAEFAFRLDQVTALAGKVKSSPFKRYDAEVIHRERWVSSVGYCLHITQCTDSQCDDIMKP